MTLNESMAASQERIQMEKVRMDALQGLRKQHFEFEPAAHQYATFWVLDTSKPDADAQPVQAMKNFLTTSGWRWITRDGDLHSGHWNELIAEITAGTLYPHSVSAGHGTVYDLRGYA